MTGDYSTPFHWAILGLAFPRWSQRIAFWVTLYWFLAWGLLVPPPLRRFVSGLFDSAPAVEYSDGAGQYCTDLGCLGESSDEPEPKRERRKVYESDAAFEF